VSEWGLTSPPTQYRLSGRQFYRSKDATNSIKALKEDKNKLTHIQKQESPAHAVKPERRKSMQKLLQFDVFRFISTNSISPNFKLPKMHSRGIASRGKFR